MRLIIIMQFQVTIAMRCQAITCCMNLSYVVGHKQAISLVLVYHVYSVSIDSIAEWMCEM
jgi:hypothetical protein